MRLKEKVLVEQGSSKSEPKTNKQKKMMEPRSNQTYFAQRNPRLLIKILIN